MEAKRKIDRPEYLFSDHYYVSKNAINSEEYGMLKEADKQDFARQAIEVCVSRLNAGLSSYCHGCPNAAYTENHRTLIGQEMREIGVHVKCLLGGCETEEVSVKFFLKDREETIKINVPAPADRNLVIQGIRDFLLGHSKGGKELLYDLEGSFYSFKEREVVAQVQDREYRFSVNELRGSRSIINHDRSRRWDGFDGKYTGKPIPQFITKWDIPVVMYTEEEELEELVKMEALQEYEASMGSFS